MIFDLTGMYAAMLVFTRAGTLFMTLPVFGGAMIPRVMRLAFGALVSLFVVPIVASNPLEVPHHFAGYILAMGSEFIVGMVMGLAVRSVFGIISMSGFLIGNATSLSRDQNMNLGEDDGGGLVGTLLYYFATVVFIVSGLHYEVIAAFVESFRLLPVGTLAAGHFNSLNVVAATARIFEIGLLMAAPFVAVNFIITTTFALLGKVAQRVNVFMISFAIRILVGFMVLIGTAGLLTHYIQNEFSNLPHIMLNFLTGV
ncbi:MAG: flagellar biosynthetic protein FliR [Opitutales bacterium]|nr:flagellar biosynthetic protein FliR [Opitutales bacterium]